MFNWLWRVLEAISVRWAYWQRKAIKCDLCKQLSWGGFKDNDGRWTCCGCRQERGKPL